MQNTGLKIDFRIFYFIYLPQKNNIMKEKQVIHYYVVFSLDIPVSMPLLHLQSVSQTEV
jgi:hypothetical protein